MPFLMVANRNYFQNGIRQLFMWIDSIVYSFVSFLMQVIFDIANMSGTSFQNLANEVMSRVYIILAIFMTFKVIVSLLTYLVNPDTMSDKQQGAGKLVLRVLLVFVMLIAQPRIFKLMYDAQLPILRTIPKIVLSVDSYGGGKTSNIDVEDQGIGISWTVFRAFYGQNADCVGEGNENDTTAKFITEFGGTDTQPPANVFSLANNHVNDFCENMNDGSVYQYDYKPFISTLAGGFLCYVLIGIAITVAIRMFKMIILQIIAPIPIISYIDPKSGKDGAFNQWLKAVISTWLDLFINLGIVYLVIFIVTELVLKSSGEVYGYISGLGTRRGLFVTIFLILGLFSFAKQAPKFIMDALGIKSKNNFSKAMGMSAASVGMVGATAGVMAGGIKDAGQAFKNKNFAAGGLALAKGIGGGLITGFGSGMKGVGAAYGADNGQTKAAIDARNKYINDRANGKNMASSLLGFGQSFVGYDLDRDIANQKSIAASAKQIRDYANSEGAKFMSDSNLGFTGDKGIIGADGKKFDFGGTRNDILKAVQEAQVTGKDVKLKGADGKTHNLGSANSSTVGKVLGDADERVGDMFMDAMYTEGALHEEFVTKYGDSKLEQGHEVLDSYVTTYARASGVSKAKARTHRSAQLKGAQKEAERKQFNLGQKKK